MHNYMMMYWFDADVYDEHKQYYDDLKALDYNEIILMNSIICHEHFHEG